MCESTDVVATIHSCPPNRVRWILETLARNEIVVTDPDEEAEDPAARATVDLGSSFSGADLRFGAAGDVAEDLPGLGMFTADCDDRGTLLFPQPTVLELGGQPEAVRQRRLGVPWLNAISAMPAAVVTEPEPCAAFWNRHTGLVQIITGERPSDQLTLTLPGGDQQTVDDAVARHGFERACSWTHVSDTTPLWHTYVYRIPTDDPETPAPDAGERPPVPELPAADR